MNGKTVASGILTWFRNSLEVPWASSINDYREKCPNNLLYWEAIRFAIRNGAAKFDFGRSTPGEGTYRFKKQWGAKPVQLNWQYLLEHGRNMSGTEPGQSEVSPGNKDVAATAGGADEGSRPTDRKEHSVRLFHSMVMRIGRTLPPAAAPLQFKDIISGVVGFLGGTKTVSRFEEELKEYYGVRHCFVCVVR